jgi:hypothetical protein
MVRKTDDTPDIDFIRRLLELYTIEEILEFDDLPPEEAVELLIQYGALSFDNIPV